MSEATIMPDGEQAVPNPNPPKGVDADPGETREWLDSLQYVLDSKGRERAQFLLAALNYKASQEGVELPLQYNTPVHQHDSNVDQQPPYPGNREIERRIKSIIRWNAMAMVVCANKRFDGMGGHISTFASSATLYEVAHNHFFRGRGATATTATDLLPGSRIPGPVFAGLPRRAGLTEANLENFRRELQPEGRALVVSAPLADARLLGVPHRLDGTRAHHVDLSSSIQPLSGRPRHPRDQSSTCLGVSWATESATNRNRSARSRWPLANSSTI